MKLQVWLLVSSLVLLCAVHQSQGWSLLGSPWSWLKRMFGLTTPEDRSHLSDVLHKMRNSLDKTLIEFFPELKQKILKLHKDIDLCYDQTIGNNKSVNIFEEKIHTIVQKYFDVNGYLLQRMNKTETRKRVKIFVQNLANLARLLIKCVAQKTNGKKNEIKLGLTPMAVYSRSEIVNKILNRVLNVKPSGNSTSHVTPSTPNTTQKAQLRSAPTQANFFQQECSRAALPGETIPESFNWNDLGYVTPVIHQWTCGSCYVFATTHALESQYMIRTKTPRSNPKYSVQTTLNCMEDGCGGGGLTEPMKHFVQVGVRPESEAPYINGVQPCDKPKNPVLKADGYCYYDNLSEEEMQRLLMRNGPAGVAIDASNPALIFLKGTPWTANCGRALDHAVLLVGWTPKYWIIKNSWGSRWGIDGYLYLPRGDNKCGVNMMFGVPIVKTIPSN